MTTAASPRRRKSSQDAQADAPTVLSRLREHPSLHPRRALKVRRRDLIIRFAAGAATSMVSGGVTLAFGPRVGGILLAFPAILAASLTLIEEQEASEDAREDARGAIAGAFALTAFAVVAALTLGHLAGALALVLAAAAWTAVALSLYVILWWK